MSTVEQQVSPLFTGQRLTQDEFLRRWEALPEVKFAELIGGIVHMSSPLSLEHGETDGLLGGWLFTYSAATPGCGNGNNATWLLLGAAPQPDLHLRILPNHGGQSEVRGRYGFGAPELFAEVSLSRADYNLGEKRELYQSAGVVEYLVVLLEEEPEVRWHRLVNGVYELLPATAGVLRSVVYPGLWLNVAAALAGDRPQVLATLNQGLASPEHAAFAAQLAMRRR